MNRKMSLALSLGVIGIIALYALLNFDELLNRPSITGHQVMSTRLVIISESDTICDMQLETGWNLVSFPCISADVPITSFLGNFSGHESLRTYIASDPSDPWKSYNPNLPNWVVQDLQFLSRKYGYWVYITNATQLYVNSSLATPTLIDFERGWHLLGYPSRQVRLVNDTFDQLVPNFDYVYLYNASDSLDPWKQYTWNTSLPSGQDLTHTVLYYGYWIYILNPDTLVIS